KTRRTNKELYGINNKGLTVCTMAEVVFGSDRIQNGQHNVTSIAATVLPASLTDLLPRLIADSFSGIVTQGLINSLECY
ncbi:hypothetical protein L9F63_015787, partial [Diploptera punctata]